jgi:hypothetical protein
MAEHANLLLARKLCKSGSHQWGEWKYVAENSCTEEAICSQCGGTRLRVGQHHWVEWQYVDKNLCDQERSCLRCNDMDKRVFHVWSDWKYIHESDCTQKRSCLRCAESHNDTRTVHPDWIVTGEDTRTEIQIVKGPGPSYDADRYEEEVTVNIKYVKCTRCNESDEW